MDKDRRIQELEQQVETWKKYSTELEDMNRKQAETIQHIKENIQAIIDSYKGQEGT